MASTAGDDVQMRKAVHLQKAKDEWLPGELAVSTSMLLFTGGHSRQIALSQVTGVQKAKGQPIMRVATASGAAVFKFTSMDDRESFLTNLNKLKDAAVAGARTRPASSLVPPTAVQEAVFKANPDLKDIHSRLVASGHITELEFWASKQRQVRTAQASLEGQQTGMPNLLQLFQKQAGGNVRFTLTKDVEQQIFAENPAVQAAYAATVPHKYSRSQFFENFFKMFQARILRRRKRAAGTLSAVDELKGDFEDEVHLYELDLLQRQQAAKRQRLAAADPTVNLAADNDDSAYDGHGLRHQPGQESVTLRQAGACAEEIASELNMHAAVVLAGRRQAGAASTSGPVTPASLEVDKQGVTTAQERSRSALEDLRAREGPSYQPLDIQGSHRYFMAAGKAEPSLRHVKPEPDAEPAAATAAGDDPFELGAAIRTAAAVLRKRDAGEAPAIVHTRDRAPSTALTCNARAALDEVYRASQHDGEVDEFGQRKNPTVALLPEMLKGMREQVVGVNELLRHLWRGFPLNTAAKTQKMARIVRALEDLYAQSEALQKAGQGQDRVYMSQLLRPTMNAMDVAFNKYDSCKKA